MNPDDIVHFLPAEELFEKAAVVFVAQKRELENVLPPVDIQQVGSSSVPGLIGKFDVDIQIRTTKEQFKDVVAMMQKKYVPKHPEIWDDGFATFCNNKKYLIDFMVTVVGSKYDDFYKVRDALIANKQLMREFNELKRQYEGKTYGEYKKAKVAFLGGNGRVKFLDDEYLDLVDENNKVIGKKLRSEVYAEHLSNFRVVNTFLINSEGKMWIPRRSADKKIFPLCLDMSMGGHVESGETYEQAFKRELKEELNIDADSVEWKLVVHLTPKKNGVSAFMNVYEIRTDKVPNYNQAIS